MATKTRNDRDPKDKAIWGVYVPRDLSNRVKAYMAKEKRTLTYVVTEAVDEFLKKRGF